MVTTAHHEIWHLAEAMMSSAVLTDLDACLADGPPWPGDYLSRPCERRARAYESFAMMLEEGCRVIVEGRGVPPEIQLFWGVFSGGFGREVMFALAPKRRPLRPPLSERLRALML